MCIEFCCWVIDLSGADNVPMLGMKESDTTTNGDLKLKSTFGNHCCTEICRKAANN